MHIEDYTEMWQMKDAITTVVEANGYITYGLRQTDYGFKLELTSHIDDEMANSLCGQFPLSACYYGEGGHGSVFLLYKETNMGYE